MIRELIRFTQWEVRVPVRFFLKKKKQKKHSKLSLHLL